MRMALRMGLRWGEWEHLQPIELLEQWSASEWRWNRQVLVQAMSVAWLRGMLDDKVDAEAIARSMGWRPEE